VTGVWRYVVWVGEVRCFGGIRLVI